MSYYRITTPNGDFPAPAILDALDELATRAVRQMEHESLAALLRTHLADERKNLEMLKTGMCTEITIADQVSHVKCIEVVLAYLLA